MKKEPDDYLCTTYPWLYADRNKPMTEYTCDAREGKDLFEYAAFELVLKKLAHAYPKARFGFPLIGCGLAGGNKEEILWSISNFAEMIDETGGTVTVVEYQK